MTTIDICGKKKVKNPEPNTFHHLSVTDMKKALVEVPGVSKMTRKELCEKMLAKQEGKLPPNLGFIHYDGHNSCYVDTMIFSLLHTPRLKWIRENLIKRVIPFPVNSELHDIVKNVQLTLQTMYENIHKKDSPSLSCSRLRKLFAAFDDVYNKKKPGRNLKWLQHQQEPTDVINILMKMFDIKPDVKTRLVSKTEKRTDVLYFNSPFIDVGELKSKRIVNMKDYIPKHTDKFQLDNGDMFKKQTSIFHANVLMINVVRNYLDIEKVTTPVIPVNKFTLCMTRSSQQCKKVMKCVSILIHHGTVKGGHYTCIFRYYKDDKWYHYNDLSPTFEYIGSNISDVINWKNGLAVKNMVACIYVRTNSLKTSS